MSRIIADMSVEELAQALTAELSRFFEKPRPNPETLYTRAQVARKLGKSFHFVDRQILKKRIRTTADGRYISQKAIDDYINGL